VFLFLIYLLGKPAAFTCHFPSRNFELGNCAEQWKISKNCLWLFVYWSLGWGFFGDRFL